MSARVEKQRNVRQILGEHAVARDEFLGDASERDRVGSVTQELIERYRVLAKNLEHVTLVFDKGNNSEENLEALGPSPYHVVGSLVPTQHPDLLEVPLDKFQSFQDARLEGVTAFRTSKKVFGRHSGPSWPPTARNCSRDNSAASRKCSGSVAGL